MQLVSGNNLTSINPKYEKTFNSYDFQDWRLNTLGALNTSSVQLINKAEAKTLTDENWVQADQLLAAVAINDSLITRSSVNPVVVETCGSHARGSVFVNYRYPTDNSTVRIVQEIDMKTYKKLLLKYFGV